MFGIPEEKRPVHVVCAPKEEYLAIITSYIPSLEKWEAEKSAKWYKKASERPSCLKAEKKQKVKN